MMRIFDLVRKDIQQIVRDRKSALFLVIMPVLFTLFFGFVLGGVMNTPSSQTDPRLPVGLVNQDPGGLLSSSLEALLPNSDVIRPVTLQADQASQAGEMVAKGQLAAVLTVPAGYSQAISSGQAASLGVIADQGTAAGRTAVTALDTVTGRLYGAVESAQISIEAYLQQAQFPDEASRQAYFEDAFKAAVAAWSQPPLTVQVQKATGQADLAQGNGGFTQSSSGMMVMFAIFGLISSGMVLVLERKSGAMSRLLTTPIRKTEIITGHILAMFLVVFAQEVLLVILGQFAFGVDYLRQPGAILLMMVAVSLWASSLGLLISSLCRREDQVVLVSLIFMFVLSALGGAWFPLEVTGKAFSTIGHLLPSAWAMDGFQNIIVRGQGFSSVLLPAGLLLGYALAFFGLAIWRFKFE
jgi:ABC-2 type transport system permease protein